MAQTRAQTEKIMVRVVNSESPQKRKSDTTDLEIAEGGTPNYGRFMGTLELVGLLLNGKTLPRIPLGIKDNVYFVVDGEMNAQRRGQGRKNIYYDDCGIYGNSSSSKASHFIRLKDGSLAYIEKRDGKYVRGKNRVVMVPQPSEDEVYGLTRYYSNLKRDPTYRRRVSWINKTPKNVESSKRIVVEYIGLYPYDIPEEHGNTGTIKSKKVKKSIEDSDAAAFLENQIIQIEHTELPKSESTQTNIENDGNEKIVCTCKCTCAANAGYLKDR